ncbi:MAG: hypothetical protein LUQ07_05485 [Methanospirillum sp.]|nr:hypothetical protein [Methanospirillum sp.]
MSLIVRVLLAGGVIYGGIFLVELLQGHVLWQALAGIGILAFSAALPLTREEHLLHEGEMIAVWSVILLFGLYAILKTGGIV